MFLGKVIGEVESDDTNSRASNSRLKMVQKLDLYRNASGPSTIAVDLIGATDGDIVMVGVPANHQKSPISLTDSMAAGNMIMGIVDKEASTIARPSA